MSPYERGVMRALANAAKEAKRTDKSGCVCAVCLRLKSATNRAEKLLNQRRKP